MPTVFAAMVEPRNTAVDERRTSTRFRKDADAERAAIWYPHGVEMLAEVYDESLEGLALIVDDATAFQTGMQVEIAYAGTLLQGTVRHLSSCDDGRTKIGFQTTPLTKRPRDD